MKNAAVALLKNSLSRFVLALLVAGSAGMGTARSDNLVLQGSSTFSTALAQPHANTVQAQTGYHLEIIPNKSDLGLLALFERRADMAMISTTLEREVEILRKSDPALPFQKLKAFEIARTRAALVIHPDNLAASHLEPGRLELEITETALLQDNEAVLEKLHQLKGYGVQISMDDFGTGYSSLSYLRSFPFDKIKIDQSFVRGLGSREDSLAIIRAVIGLGRNLGMTITAEGVETRSQLTVLRQERCDEVQGFLFSPAVPLPETHRLLGFNRSSASIVA